MRTRNRTPTFEDLRLIDRLRQYMLVCDPDYIDLHGKRWKNTKYRWLGSLENGRDQYHSGDQLQRAIDHLEAWRDDKWCPRVNSMSQLIAKLGAIREHTRRMHGRTPKRPREPSFDVAGTPIDWEEQKRAKSAAVSPKQAADNAKAALQLISSNVHYTRGGQ